jgi:hypothetical protein
MSVVHKALWVMFCLQVTPLLVGQQQRDESSQGLSVVGAGQSEFTRIHGPEDRDVPLPQIENASHPKDPSAIQELIEYLNAVGLKEWTGMQAKGVLLQSNGEGGNASLGIGIGDQARLDVVTASGTRSTRIDGNRCIAIHADGKRVTIPPATAKAELVSFPRLFTENFGRIASAIIDRGQVNIDGETLHRITVEEPVLLNGEPAEPDTPSITDLYFDPAKHLLRMSASLVQVDSADRERYLVVSRYSDYQRDGTLLMPHSIRQTLNGQQQWTLQLTEIELHSASDPSYFQF